MRWRGSHRTLGLISALAGSLGLAVLTTAATPRPLCACTSKSTAYLAALKADLRNLVTAQERFYADSLRYTSIESELVPHGYRLSPRVELVSLSAWSGGYSARVRFVPATRPTGFGALFPFPSEVVRECEIAAGLSRDGSAIEWDGEPRCDALPLDRRRFVMAGVYALLVLVAIAVRVSRAGVSLPPVGAGMISVFVLLGAAHPFWTDYQMKDACALGVGIEWLSICVAAIVALWMIVRRRETWRPSHPA